jgi:hypothetical protein
MHGASNQTAISCTAILFALLTGLAFGQAPTFKPTFEKDTDRQGQDYHNFHPAAPSAQLCQMACIADAQCRAWAYGPADQSSQTCWLKNKVPPPVKWAGHVAGVVRPEGPIQAAAATPNIVQMAIQSSAQHAVRCIDVPNAQFTQGVRLQMYDCNDTAAQLFCYNLTTQHLIIGNLCVQAAGNAQQGAAVILGPCSEQASASWKVVAKGDWVQFVRVNDLCLDTGGPANNGAQLQVWQCSGAGAQLWGFSRVKVP